MRMIQKIPTQKLKTKKHTSRDHKVKIGEDFAETTTLIAQGLHLEIYTAEDTLHISHRIVINHDQIQEHKAHIKGHRVHFQEHKQAHNKHHKHSHIALDVDAQIALKSRQILKALKCC